jgi:SAM-dependent methyltransferase
MIIKLAKNILPHQIIRLFRYLITTLKRYKDKGLSSTEYWTRYHVDSPDKGFSSVKESLEHLEWRNNQYPGHLSLMPVDQANDSVVLDYGCGPGNDIIGFGVYSNPQKIIAVDVSDTSIKLAQQRAKLHTLDIAFYKLNESSIELPLENNSVDIIHSAGVLHHTPNPQEILKELGRVLKKDGYMQIMVYNRDSIWMHLHVAYEMKVLNGLYSSISLDEAFSRTTDGEGCPIANCYTPDSFLSLANQANLNGEHLGSTMSLFELKRLPMLKDALNNNKLNNESRDFLNNITFNNKNWPLFNNKVAGINSYFRLTNK